MRDELDPVREGAALLQEGLGSPQWRRSAQQEDGSWIMPWPEYPERLITALTSAMDITGTDYEYHERIDAVRRIPIREASSRDLSTWFTYVFRGEKFSDGHIAKFIRSGELQALFERLIELSGNRGTAE